MHEHHEACHIIEHGEEEAKRLGKSKVTKIKLVIGENSGFDPEAVKMNIELAAEGTMCEDAEVEVRFVRTMLKCPNCGEMFPRKPFHYECPHCGTEGIPTDIGKEMGIDGFECE